MTDSYRHKGMRKSLVETLRQKGIHDEAVMAAIGAIPRHFFLDKAFEEHAYEDKAFPIGNEQTISQPYTVAYQTQLLDVQARDRVLEIGTGSGYQAAVLAALGARVFTIERQETLYLHARSLLHTMGLKTIQCFFGDGTSGLPDYAPYDKILVTAGAPVVPEALKNQLMIGGRLVIPVGDSVQHMHLIRRINAGKFETEILKPFRFVPFLDGIQRQ
ncbi:MAG: protein-L-isoaspartate(D-aspartate) O-methyltransferase [Bacteroidetes bacterium]|nr:protein-L-isoaspartate(D-aspartate) O-methyltransferase [Bacteroidota bacterium]